MRILCANWTYADEAALEREHFPGVDFVVARGSAGSPAALDEQTVASADAIINYSPTQLLGAEPAAFPQARIVVRHGVGFDNLDLAGWGARGVPVCNVPDYGTTEVADHALGLMLTITRGTHTYAAALQRDAAAGWNFALAPAMRRHKGATFGVVGLGRIGLAAARRAAGFDMRVMFYDPLLPSGVDLATGFTRVHSLADLFSRCDVVSIHAPLSTATRGMVNAEVLDSAKPGLTLINTARGPIVDLDALEAAMRADRVAAAGLDVLPNEPGDLDHPLLRAWREREPWIDGRLVITPHAAFYSPDAIRDLRLKSIEVAYVFLADGRLTNCVNREFLAPPPAAVAP